MSSRKYFTITYVRVVMMVIIRFQFAEMYFLFVTKCWSYGCCVEYSLLAMVSDVDTMH